MADGWAIQGVVIIQSGQPFSVIDYSGAVGSVFYSIYDGITNPIDPLCNAAAVSAGACAKPCTPQSAVTGANGATPGLPALNPACFTLPILSAGSMNGAIPYVLLLHHLDVLAIRLKPISLPASATFSGNPGRGARTYHF